MRHQALVALSERYGLTAQEVTVLLALPSRTLARRKVEDKFLPEESDRLVRVGRIGALAEEIFGDSQKAASWLRRPNRALVNESPLRQLDTDIGVRQVENLLLRIAHGVYT